MTVFCKEDDNGNFTFVSKAIHQIAYVNDEGGLSLMPYELLEKEAELKGISIDEMVDKFIDEQDSSCEDVWT